MGVRCWVAVTAICVLATAFAASVVHGNYIERRVSSSCATIVVGGTINEACGAPSPYQKQVCSISARTSTTCEEGEFSLQPDVVGADLYYGVGVVCIVHVDRCSGRIIENRGVIRISPFD